MNKNYERCTRCNHRKLLTTTGLRKWLKPMECKHLQRAVDSKRDLDETDIVNRVLVKDRGSTGGANKFVKFWKSKLFLTNSVRSLQRYFTIKVGSDDFSSPYSKITDCDICDPSPEKRMLLPSGSDNKRDVESTKLGHVKCPHSDGHLVLRGHEKHTSAESCAIYCQLSKHGWYWGGITSSEAEALLAGQHDNVFLVRDSYSSRHLLCVSFRCVGRTLHARLRHANGLFSLNNENFVPANRISEHCATVDVATQLFERPVRLARPLNRFAKLDSLQLICRFVIRQTISPLEYQNLPLPTNLIHYISLGSDYIPPHS